MKCEDCENPATLVLRVKVAFPGGSFDPNPAYETLGFCDGHLRRFRNNHPDATVLWDLYDPTSPNQWPPKVPTPPAPDKVTQGTLPTSSARRTDPETSHVAVAKLVAQHGKQGQVADTARDLGEFTDTELTEALRNAHPETPWVRNNVARLRLTVAEKTGAIERLGRKGDEIVWRWITTERTTT